MAKGLPLKGFGVYVLAAFVGASGALLGVGFQKLLAFLQALFTGSPEQFIADAARNLSTWQRLLTPALGGLLAALVLWSIRWKRGPFGLGDMLELAITRKGTIAPVASFVQILSSALSISSGASIGKEGPNSQLGATMAAILGKWFKLSSRTNTILLGAGVAAGMTCAYRAPIAGAMLVMEIVLGNFAMDVFAPIVVASVVALLVFNTFVEYGSEGLYVTQVQLKEPVLVLSAILLGVLCAFGSVLFRKSLDLGKRVFSRVHILVAFPLAGLVVGAIGVWFPQTWGNGFDVISQVCGVAKPGEDLPPPVPLFSLVAWLLVWKLVATALSTGSGALGGIFTPNLVVGAVFGWFFGDVVASLTQSAGDPRRAFAFVGLAGLCAATTHAPISSVLLVLEFTHDYSLILPVMLCSIVGSVVSSLLDEDSVYTARLRAKGHAVHGGVEQLAMQSTYVRDIMRKDAERLVNTTGFEQIMDVFGRSRRNSIYVVDGEGRLEGLIHIHDVKNFINDPSLDSVVIAGDLTRPTAGATPDQSLAQVALRFDDPELDELPVVASANGRALLGRITRSDLVGRLSSEVLTKRNLRSRWRSSEGGEVGTYELPAGAEIARLTLPDALVGHTVESADFGKFGVVVLVVTKPVEDGPDESVVAEPLVPLEAGARLLVLGRKPALEEFQRQHGMM